MFIVKTLRPATETASQKTLQWQKASKFTEREIILLVDPFCPMRTAPGILRECHRKFLLMVGKRQVKMEDALVVQHVDNCVFDAS